MGYTYQEKRTFDVLDKAAQNEGAGAGVLGASMGMGLGINVGNMVGGSMANAMKDNIGTPSVSNQQVQNSVELCANCNAPLPQGARFCMNCGQKVTSTSCPDCGAAIIPGARFCPQCGKQL